MNHPLCSFAGGIAGLVGDAVFPHPLFSSLRKKSMRHLILGGAAVHRCDQHPVQGITTVGFSLTHARNPT